MTEIVFLVSSYLWINISPPVVSQNQNARCKTPCSLRTTCENCTSQGMECMWCGSTKRCVDSNAYVISFPYGQCLEWQTGDCVCKCLYLHKVATLLEIAVWSFVVSSLEVNSYSGNQYILSLIYYSDFFSAVCELCFAAESSSAHSEVWSAPCSFM